MDEKQCRSWSDDFYQKPADVELHCVQKRVYSFESYVFSVFNRLYTQVFFSPHFGNKTRPPELGIFRVFLDKIGKSSHHII